MTRIIIFSLILISLQSCTETSSTKSQDGLSHIQSQFIDDPVKGLTYVASEKNGMTGESGYLNCIPDEKIHFKLFGKSIGYALCSEKIFVDDLISTDEGHSSEKVAALIQTFSTADSTEFDLTTVQNIIPRDELIDFSYLDDDTSFFTQLDSKVSQLKTSYPILNSIISSKNPADMRSLLNNGIEKYSEIPELVKEKLDAISGSSMDTFEDLEIAGKIISISGNLISSVGELQDFCFRNLQMNVSILKDLEAPFKISVHHLAIYNNSEDYNNLTNSCRIPLSECDDENSSLFIPKIKPITSEKIKLLNFNQVDGFTTESRIILNLKTADDHLILNGDFELLLSWEGNSTTKCSYEIAH